MRLITCRVVNCSECKKVSFCELFIPYKKSDYSPTERDFSKITIFLFKLPEGSRITLDHLT